MKLFQLAFATLLTGLALGAIEDEVTCIFNNFRRQANLEPLKISTRLMQTANEIVAASRSAGKTLLVVPGDRSMGDRYKRAGYEFSDAATLGGQGYKTGKIFAEAMINYSPITIRNPELKHLGYAKSNAFSNLDLGDSYNDDEPVREAIGC